MANHWSTIQTACNKWHGIVEEVAARPKSGANVEGQGRVVREVDGSWPTLDKANETYNPDAPAPPAAEGRPEGTKKATAARDAAPAAERLQASIEQCITNAKSSAAKREEKSDARSSALMANQHVNLDLVHDDRRTCSVFLTA
ncbi:putative methionyl-tRNA synthetase [Hordeum vulgare]|nr:putative methionyl-tRNA synthetase [Hordeum vulgare]